jgi:hypothetical protein
MTKTYQQKTSLMTTKHAVSTATPVPTEKEAVQLFGALKGTVKIIADIIASIDEKWDAEQ